MRVERVAYAILTTGLVTSATLLAAGLALYVAIRGEPEYRVVVLAATIALISTPPITIAASLAAFASRGEKHNALVALAVLMIMALSVLLGVALHMKAG